MSSAGKRLRRSLQSGTASALVAALSRLPLPVARAIGTGIGRIGNWVSPASRQRTREHLAAAFDATRSELALRRIARANLPTLASQVCELLVFQRWGIERTLAEVEFEGLERFETLIENALAGGRGMIGVSAHFGHWELTAALFSRACGGNALCIARRYEHEGYQRILETIRRRIGIRVQYQEDSLTPVIRLLRRGGALGVLPDQDYKQLQDGIFVDFLGRPAYTTTAPAELALRTGAPLLVATLHRAGDRIRIQISEPADLDRCRRAQDPVRALTEWWSREIERRIRSDPTQWVWLHRRWRTTPDRLEYRASRRRDREFRGRTR